MTCGQAGTGEETGRRTLATALRPDGYGCLVVSVYVCTISRCQFADGGNLFVIICRVCLYLGIFLLLSMLLFVFAFHLFFFISIPLLSLFSSSLFFSLSPFFSFIVLGFLSKVVISTPLSFLQNCRGTVRSTFVAWVATRFSGLASQEPSSPEASTETCGVFCRDRSSKHGVDVDLSRPPSPVFFIIPLSLFSFFPCQ